MPNLGPMEILVVLVVALIVLGPKRLPEAGRQVGRALSEVRRWSESMQAEVRGVLDDDQEAPPPAPWVSPIPRAEDPAAEARDPDGPAAEVPPPDDPPPDLLPPETPPPAGPDVADR
ncbi:MAG: twin-arginine translocase TatA/TatE family subunit [Actinobacteria bacterium]|nr:twin-arginine translocase TatA/TatE family subunit [Actinomycetota bacterium]